MASEVKSDAAADGTAAKGDDSSAELQDLALKVVGAIGTGIGILGFVTLFGGAILWLRASQAELPANDAVSVIPNSVLVTTGASFLIPAVLIAFLAVGTISLVHFCGYLSRRIRKRSAFEQADKLLLKAERIGRDAEAGEARAKAARAFATSLGETADQAKQNPAASEERKEELAKAAAAQRLEAEEKEEEALSLASAAASRRAEAENLRASSLAAVARSRRQFVTELVLGGLALAILPPVLNRAIFHLGFWSGEVPVLIFIAVAGTVVSLAAYVATNRFIWFGVVAFVTVGVYIGFATYFSTTGNPKVEPAAALRSGYPPIVGIYVADTASNLYLGSLPEADTPARLRVIPRAQVVDVAVGPLVDPHLVRKRALTLVRELCRQKVKDPKAAASVKPAPACKPEQLKALQGN